MLLLTLEVCCTRSFSYRIRLCLKAKGDTQQSHMRKRDTANGKSEKKEDKEKSKDTHEVADRKDKETKKEIEDKGSEASELFIQNLATRDNERL